MGIFSANELRSFILLIIVALLAPEVIGFQYLEWWWSGNTHFTFMISSITWGLAYSDWFFGVEETMNGWLFYPNPFTSLPSNLLLFLVAPVIRLIFVAVVAFYRQGRIDKSILVTISILLLGVTIAECASSMLGNGIYGIPPGVLFSILTPDVDTKLFLPIPILLIAGLLLSKKPNLSDVEA